MRNHHGVLLLNLLGVRHANGVRSVFHFGVRHANRVGLGDLFRVRHANGVRLGNLFHHRNPHGVCLGASLLFRNADGVGLSSCLNFRNHLVHCDLTSTLFLAILRHCPCPGFGRPFWDHYRTSYISGSSAGTAVGDNSAIARDTTVYDGSVRADSYGIAATALSINLHGSGQHGYYSGKSDQSTLQHC